MFGLAVIPAAIFALGMLFLPESPRWLAMKGIAQVPALCSCAFAEHPTWMRRWRKSKPRSRRGEKAADLGPVAPSLRPALVVGIGLAIFQQVTGINTVIYYAPIIIQSAGISSASGAILATAGIGIVNVLMTVVSMWLIDRIGRRPLLLTGIGGMIVTLGILGLAFHISMRTGALAWVAVISMMAYVASFAISLGPIFWLLISEIYPLKIRSSSEGLAATFNWGSNLVVSLTFLTLVQRIGASSTFFLYALFAVGGMDFFLSVCAGNKRPHPRGN